jgi:hypothetical protein
MNIPAISILTFRCAGRLGAISAALLALAVAPAGADTFHSWFEPFSVTIVEPESNIFNSSPSFNGNGTILANYDIASNAGEQTTTTFSDQHLSLIFTADPGYAFDQFSMGFGPFFWENDYVFGGYALNGAWSISAGNYVGATSWTYLEAARNYGWDISGQSGIFHFDDYNWWSGGAGEGRAIMDGFVQLPDVTEFSVTLDMGATLYSNSEFGARFETQVDMVTAPTGGGDSVPEAGTTLGLILPAIGGLALVRRRSESVQSPATGI